jgi:hypothetical protein
LKRNVLRLARFAKINKKEVRHPDWRGVYPRKTAPQMASPTVYITLSLLWERRATHRVRYWEIIADKLSKASWSWGGSQPWIPKGERSGLLTRIAFVELESAISAGSAAHPKKSQIILRRSRHHHK